LTEEQRHALRALVEDPAGEIAGLIAGLIVG
jgi:hypothetical protein